jgi:hypothetical protein
LFYFIFASSSSSSSSLYSRSNFLEKIIYTFLSDQLSHPILGSKRMYAFMQACHKWEIDPKNLPEVAIAPQPANSAVFISTVRDRGDAKEKEKGKEKEYLNRINSSGGSSHSGSTPTSPSPNLNAYQPANGTGLGDSAEREGSVLGEKLFLHASSSTNYDFYKITTKECVDTKVPLL